jgi:hypothetical protein
MDEQKPWHGGQLSPEKALTKKYITRVLRKATRCRIGAALTFELLLVSLRTSSG